MICKCRCSLRFSTCLRSMTFIHWWISIHYLRPNPDLYRCCHCPLVCLNAFLAIQTSTSIETVVSKVKLWNPKLNTLPWGSNHHATFNTSKTIFLPIFLKNHSLFKLIRLACHKLYPRFIHWFIILLIFLSIWAWFPRPGEMLVFYFAKTFFCLQSICCMKIKSAVTVFITRINLG